MVKAVVCVKICPGQCLPNPAQATSVTKVLTNPKYRPKQSDVIFKRFLIAYISTLTTSFDEIINPIFYFISSAIGGNPDEGIIGSLKCILKKMVVTFIKKYIYDILAGAKGFGFAKTARDMMTKNCLFLMSIFISMICEQILMILFSLIVKQEMCSTYATCFNIPI